MDRRILEKRTKQFHIGVIRLCRQLPRDAAGFETARQVIRSAGSVGANYRATRRAKSTDDFIYKIAVVLEESDESHYWLEVIKESEMLACIELDNLIQEAFELTAIFTAVCKTSKEKRAQAKAKPKI